MDTNFSEKEILWFLEEIAQSNRQIKLYAGYNLDNVINSDEWFLDTGLDIFKMWDAVSKTSFCI